MGKGSVNESLPNFGGCYGGGGSFPEVKEAVETADAVLWLGSYKVSCGTYIADNEFTC